MKIVTINNFYDIPLFARQAETSEYKVSINSALDSLLYCILQVRPGQCTPIDILEQEDVVFILHGDGVIELNEDRVVLNDARSIVMLIPRGTSVRIVNTHKSAWLTVQMVGTNTTNDKYLNSFLKEVPDETTFITNA